MKLELGTIIHGTMRIQDTMPALLSALDGIRLSADDRRACDDVRRSLNTWMAESCDPDDADNILFDLETDMHDTLIPIAEQYIPDYCYIGSHPGDGADLGVWPCEELLDDTTQGSYDGYCWRLGENNHPTDETIPADMTHAIAVNDHGNATLYRRSGRTWTECWAIA